VQKLFDFLRDKDHVIWDWNGTLLDDVGHAVATMNTLLAPRGLPPLDLGRYRQTFGFPLRGYYEACGFDLRAEPLPELCEAFVERFMAGVYDCPLVPGSRELLHAVKRAGKTQSVLSATDQENLENMVSGFQLETVFDFVFGIGDKLASSKVYRGHELLSASGVDRTRTVLVGDTDHDLEVGRALGVPVVLVAHGHQSPARLRSIHDTVLEC
jgi:phosphoglycolate phosphatase